MSAIAAFVHEGKVWIGADSAGVAGTSLGVRSDQKVFRNGDFIFGFTSSFRMGQLLRYCFNPPARKEGQDVYAYMVTEFINAVRDYLKAGGFAAKLNEVEKSGVFLVGFKGRLFRIDSDYQVGEHVDGYDACGCGEDICRGALFATKGMEPKKRLEIALSAAVNHSAAVRGPFHIESC